jgi:hypothetical protein
MEAGFVITVENIKDLEREIRIRNRTRFIHIN